MWTHLYLKCEKKNMQNKQFTWIIWQTTCQITEDYLHFSWVLLKKKKNPEFSLRPRCSFGTSTECETVNKWYTISSYVHGRFNSDHLQYSVAKGFD